MVSNIEERVEDLQKSTGLDEDVVGCYVSNYKERHICPVATGGWCKDFTKCRTLEQIGGE